MSITPHPPMVPDPPSDGSAASGQDAIYADITRLINQLQTIDVDSQREIAVSLLMITRWLYLSARQCQIDADLYRQAADCALRREQEIKELLATSLQLARALDLPGLDDSILGQGPDTPAAGKPERSGLRAYLLRILEHIKEDFQVAAPILLGNGLAAPPSVSSGVPVVLPPVEAPATIIVPASPALGSSPVDDPQLVVYCLGAFKAYWGNIPINRWYGLKGLAIFKYLLVNRAQPIPKDLLMERFWPEVEPEAARRNLHQAVYSLRRTLRSVLQEVRLIEFENDCYQINPAVSIWLDMDEFQRHRLEGLRLEQAGRLPEALVAFSIAESLYHADFLEEDLYEEWTLPHRRHLRDTYQDLAGRLSEHYYNQSEFTAAIAICRRLIWLDSCNEEAYRRLMRCYLAQGQRHLAIRQYLACVEALQTELNLPPSRKTVSLYQQLTQHISDITSPQPMPRSI